MMAATFDASRAEPTFGKPVALFNDEYDFGQNISIANYDVTRDGRFIMLRRGTHGGRLRAVNNWTEELKHVLAAGGVRCAQDAQSINDAACRGMRGRHSVGWSGNWTQSTCESTVPVWLPDRPPSRRGSIGACLLNIRFASLSSLLERLNGLLLSSATAA